MFLSILIFIITLLVLVLIHEFGHFLMAKRFGIKVLEFGFGIPPRAWGKKIGETVYSINWLPLGGFVRLLGEDKDEPVGKKTQSGDFRAKPVWQRITVVVAGVTMNLLLAWAFFYTVLISQNFKIIYPTQEAAVYIFKVEKDFPAEKAGVKSGEKLVSIDDQKVSDIDAARKLIKSKKETPLTLTLANTEGKNEHKVTLTPASRGGEVLIGVIFSPIPFREYSSFSEKLFSGITYSWDITRVTFAGLGQVMKQVITGNFAAISKSVAGPVGLAVVTNDILSSGWEAILPYLWFVGVISLTLAIFNVLPIPALDGGRLLFLVIEAVSKRQIKAEIENKVHQIGFVILIALALLVTYSDIRKLLP